MTEANGHRSLDLRDLVEPAHIILPSGTYDLPLDIPLRIQGGLQRIGSRLQQEDVPQEEYERLESELWNMADELFSKAVPRPEKPIRELITLPAFFRLTFFLAAPLRELTTSTVPSPSSTPTTAGSSSETSLSPAP